MLRGGSCAAWVVSLALCSAGVGQEDLRKRYGTRSLTAARRIAEALRQGSQRKLPEALRSIDAALRADPACEFALFQKALFLGDLGRVPEAIQAYRKCLALTEDGRKPATSVTINAAVNLGLTLCRLRRNDEAHLWFTQAVVRDPADRYKLRWKAYRNLGISLHSRGRYLSALVAVLLARGTNPARVPPKMVTDFAGRVGEDEEVAQILYFRHEVPTPAPRPEAKALSPVSPGQEVPERVLALRADPSGRFVAAIVADSSWYYLLRTEGPKPAIRKVPLPEPAVCACLAGGTLYVVSAKQPRAYALEPLTGRVARQISLGSRSPRCLAVFPSRDVAYFPVDRTVHGVKLSTGRLFATDIPGQHVAGHPDQRFLYSFVKPDPGAGHVIGHVIIGGRPVRYHIRPVGRAAMAPTTLFRAVLVEDGLLLSGVRDNASANGYRIVLSPDGHWLALPGGGGWRPAGRGGTRGGYGVAVFGAENIDHVQGFFATGAYPKGAAFNPVTGQVAVVRTRDVRVCDLADPQTHQLLKVKCSGPCAWSGTGRHLVLAGEKSGILLYRGELSPAEERLAATWWRKLAPSGPHARGPQAPPTSARAVPRLRTFQVRRRRGDVAEALAAALRENRTESPVPWRRHAPYAADAEALAAAEEGGRGLRNRDAIGIAIYKLKQAVPKHAEYPPLRYYLAAALHIGGQLQAAEEHYLHAIRTDQGRTDLTGLSLDGLHDVLRRQGEELAAAYCLAEALRLDRANPKVLQRISPLLKKHAFTKELRKLSEVKAAGGPPAAIVPAGEKLPKLSHPSGRSRKRPAAAIYAQAAPSVVLIQNDARTGTGFCVGKAGILLTNAHLLRGAEEARVSAFTYARGKLTKLPATFARVIYRSEEQDIAVLRLSDPPATLKPLPVASFNARTGEKVYAIGNPGLGRGVLEQSLSEGIVSAAVRQLEGHTYLQHTAAINPGNSGGPLLNSYGHVVGMTTLKARLENVGFAIRASDIRKVFAGP